MAIFSIILIILSIITIAISVKLNVLNEALGICSIDPLTGSKMFAFNF